MLRAARRVGASVLLSLDRIQRYFGLLVILSETPWLDPRLPCNAKIETQNGDFMQTCDFEIGVAECYSNYFHCVELPERCYTSSLPKRGFGKEQEAATAKVEDQKALPL